VLFILFIGNWFNDACKFSPGSSPDVINVGATDIKDKLFMSFVYGSNYGACVSLYAPGQSVIAAIFKQNYRYFRNHAGLPIVWMVIIIFVKNAEYRPVHLLNL